MRYLVTGATGFVGGAVAEYLRANGNHVRALVRRQHLVEDLEHRGYEPVEGNLADRASLVRAADGMDGVFHVAALYSFWQRDRSEIYSTNVGGTENVVAAARQAGVGRIVFTSSIGVFPSSEPGRSGKGVACRGAITETDGVDPDNLPDDYHRSKALAERVALGANDSSLEVVAVNPTTPIGPGDVKPTPTGRIVLEFLRRKFVGYVEGQMNFVPVEDVAAGHIAAMEKGRPGEKYILGGDNLAMSDVFRILNDVTGLRRRPFRIPYRVAYVAGMLDLMIEGMVLRRQPFIPLAGLRALRDPMWATSAKATRELGYSTGSIAGAFERSVRWFVDHEYAQVTFPKPISPASGENNSG